MRLPLLAAAIVLVLLYAAAAMFGAAVMPSYLAAWLFCLSVPVGALPIVMGLELVGRGGSLHTGFLRWPLILLPVAALAGLPVLFFLPALYPWIAHPPHGLAGLWFTQPGFIVRSLVYLIVWSALALLNLRPPADAPRAAFCATGLAVHAVIGTLAAIDWIMSLAPGLDAAGFGLMVMAGQCALSVSVALILVPARANKAVSWLATAMLAWGLLQFTQYLIVWSANRPDEIAWYLKRDDGLGVAAAWAGLVALLMPILLLVAGSVLQRRGLLTACAVLVLAVQMIAALWLVTPSIRGTFVLALPDIALPVFAMLAAGFLWMLRPRAVAA